MGTATWRAMGRPRRLPPKRLERVRLSGWIDRIDAPLLPNGDIEGRFTGAKGLQSRASPVFSCRGRRERAGDVSLIQSGAGLNKPDIHDEAVAILQRPIERVVIHRSEAGPDIEFVGEIVRLVEARRRRRQQKSRLERGGGVVL